LQAQVNLLLSHNDFARKLKIWHAILYKIQRK